MGKRPDLQSARRRTRVDRVVRRMTDQSPSPTDPQGSYTGAPREFLIPRRLVVRGSTAQPQRKEQEA